MSVTSATLNALADALEGRRARGDAAALRRMLGADATLVPLLRAAPPIRRMFALAAPDAPGLCVWGAEVALGSRLVFATGSGTTQRDAFASCLGEALERAAILAPAPAMRTSTCPAWRARIPGMPARVPAQGGVPIDLIWRRDNPAFPPPWPLSAGCAAGRDEADAALRASLELLERDALARWWWGETTPAPLTLDDSAEAAATLVTLRAGSTARRTWLLVITPPARPPVVIAASADAQGGQVTLGFACRLQAPAAARAAVLEMAQMELALHLVRHKTAVLNPADYAHLARAKCLRAAMPGLVAQGPPRPRSTPSIPPMRHITLRAGTPAVVRALSPALFHPDERPGLADCSLLW